MQHLTLSTEPAELLSNSLPSAQERAAGAYLLSVSSVRASYKILPAFFLPSYLPYNFRPPFTIRTREPQNTYTHSLTTVWEISTTYRYPVRASASVLVPRICADLKMKNTEEQNAPRLANICFVLCDTFHNTRSIITTHTTVSRFSSNIWNEHWIKQIRGYACFSAETLNFWQSDARFTQLW